MTGDEDGVVSHGDSTSEDLEYLIEALGCNEVMITQKFHQRAAADFLVSNLKAFKIEVSCNPGWEMVAHPPDCIVELLYHSTLAAVEPLPQNDGDLLYSIERTRLNHGKMELAVHLHRSVTSFNYRNYRGKGESETKFCFRITPAGHNAILSEPFTAKTKLMPPDPESPDRELPLYVDATSAPRDNGVAHASLGDLTLSPSAEAPTKPIVSRTAPPQRSRQRSEPVWKEHISPKRHAATTTPTRTDGPQALALSTPEPPRSFSIGTVEGSAEDHALIAELLESLHEGSEGARSLTLSPESSCSFPTGGSDLSEGTTDGSELLDALLRPEAQLDPTCGPPIVDKLRMVYTAQNDEIERLTKDIDKLENQLAALAERPHHRSVADNEI